MPSCVVRSCKIKSGTYTKQKGVTFHLFPKSVAWKWKWIKVIRECRNQPEWLPSPYSVVCSVHFAESDMYNAPSRHRRIVQDAAPTLNLYNSNITEPKKSQRTLTYSTVRNASVAVQSAVEIPDSKMVTDDQELSRKCDEEIEQYVIEMEPTEDVETGEIETQTNDLDECLIIRGEPKKQTNKISTDKPAPQQNVQNDSNVAPDSTDYVTELDMKRAQLNESRKRVQMVYEKLKRSRKRNLKMKNILKEIKSRNLLDRDTFKKLTACLFHD